MSRFAGYRLLACPSCQTVHAVANQVSFNLMSFESWTDGQKRHALMGSREGVRQCAQCEAMFLEREAKFVGHTRRCQRDDEVPYQIPDFLLRPAYETNWSWQGLRERLIKLGQWVLRGGLPSAAAGPAQSSEAAGSAVGAGESPKLDYPEFLYVPDSALASIIENPTHQSDPLMLALRKLYWRYLNDPYRDKARRFKAHGMDATVGFFPTELQTQNMRALLQLTYHYQPEDVVTLAELHRELGEFDIAVRLLKQCEADNEEANTIRDAAVSRVAAPLPVVYAWQTPNRSQVDCPRTP